MTESGLPVAMGLVARINPLVLAAMGIAVIVHGATALYDVSIATEDPRSTGPCSPHAGCVPMGEYVRILDAPHPPGRSVALSLSSNGVGLVQRGQAVLPAAASLFGALLPPGCTAFPESDFRALHPLSRFPHGHFVVA